ncbi:MAG: NAD(P)H-hydrate epimerase [Phycisphaeraceae bacterium]|nr:NAD(P)H-hydrate epimerase [Phycisphaeraceae bacterium]
MSLSLTRRQLQRLDQLAVERLRVPSIVLMENAARNAADAIDEHVRHHRCEVAVVCGGGNNGGDGYAIARHLHRLGHLVTLHAAVLPADLKGDAATNCAIAQCLGLAIEPMSDAPQGQVIVDAVLGTGFPGGAVRPAAAAAIEAINTARDRLHAQVVAIDLPSGLDCDSGEPGWPTVVADLTVTFAALKVGFANPAAQSYLGHVVVRDIGVLPEWVVMDEG